MDYIFKDIDENKLVGEVNNISKHTYYVFDVYIPILDTTITCSLYKKEEWWITITLDIGEDIVTDLGYPTDIFWNTRSIYDELNNFDTSSRIAYAIKAVFEKYNM